MENKIINNTQNAAQETIGNAQEAPISIPAPTSAERIAALKEEAKTRNEERLNLLFKSAFEAATNNGNPNSAFSILFSAMVRFEGVTEEGEATETYRPASITSYLVYLNKNKHKADVKKLHNDLYDLYALCISNLYDKEEVPASLYRSNCSKTTIKKEFITLMKRHGENAGLVSSQSVNHLLNTMSKARNSYKEGGHCAVQTNVSFTTFKSAISRTIYGITSGNGFTVNATEQKTDEATSTAKKAEVVEKNSAAA